MEEGISVISRQLMRHNYVTVHAKTLRKSAQIFFEIEADFASPIFNLFHEGIL